VQSIIDWHDCLYCASFGQARLILDLRRQVAQTLLLSGRFLLTLLRGRDEDRGGPCFWRNPVEQDHSGVYRGARPH
jgi:hypothetical protein